MKERVEGWLRETQPCSQTAQAHWETKQTQLQTRSRQSPSEDSKSLDAVVTGSRPSAETVPFSYLIYPFSRWFWREWLLFPFGREKIEGY